MHMQADGCGYMPMMVAVEQWAYITVPGDLAADAQDSILPCV